MGGLQSSKVSRSQKWRKQQEIIPEWKKSRRPWQWNEMSDFEVDPFSIKDIIWILSETWVTAKA
jgi:hypothetical protein